MDIENEDKKLIVATIKSMENCRVTLFKWEEDNALLIFIDRVIPKEERENYFQYKILRTFSKSYYVETIIALSELTTSFLMLFRMCEEREDFHKLWDSGDLKFEVSRKY